MHFWQLKHSADITFFILCTSRFEGQFFVHNLQLMHLSSHRTIPLGLNRPATPATAPCMQIYLQKKLSIKNEPIIVTNINIILIQANPGNIMLYCSNTSSTLTCSRNLPLAMDNTAKPVSMIYFTALRYLSSVAGTVALFFKILNPIYPIPLCSAPTMHKKPQKLLLKIMANKINIIRTSIMTAFSKVSSIRKLKTNGNIIRIKGMAVFANFLVLIFIT
ncbi:hypothetical protein MSHOH_2396 [Methanosarcina horonobensis HB-1 = JCM 15518]|uniref:Uncharacterized protein n=1 Tax=Methanosarcina horonobensis HB-1 = JCM 15518 TaxID=1434110 RepID=A0A0E3SAT9_9EURY|nr:hypothetical protein MSHOH_2396 [Methanosarcina horonobensis HB-1 = JCM 15518]